MKIAILDDYQGAASGAADWGRLGARVEITTFDRHLGGEAEVIRALAPFDAVVAMRERTWFRRQVIEALPKLRLIATTGMWNAAIDLEAATAAGIRVCGSRGLRYSTAELAWGLILSLSRNLRTESRAFEAGQWQKTIGIDLHGKTLGVLGLGELGSRVARVGLAFDMKVIAWSQNLTAEKAATAGVRLVTKDELFSESDVLSLHVILSDRSRGIVGERELRRMKPTAFLVNTARGPLVDEAALVAALRERRIAGAGLDTYDVEPLPAGHPLRTLDNVVLMPHLGYVTAESYRLMYGDVVEAIEGFLDGRAVRPLNTLPPKER
jgi:phosphoglycerate dehydrogenase-like enzyme